MSSIDPEISQMGSGPSAAPAVAEVKGLGEELARLRSLLVLALVAMVALSLVVNLYLFREMVTTRKDLAAVEARVGPAAEQYAKEQAPMIQAFLNNLIAFGKSNPDFVPILQKYNLVQGPPVQKAGISPTGVPVLPVK